MQIQLRGALRCQLLRNYSDEHRLKIAFNPVKDYGEGWQQVASDCVVALALDDVLRDGMLGQCGEIRAT